MKLITRDTDYAIRALCYIARHGRRVVAVPELVRELKIPRPFLRKILQELNKKGILKSLKGQGGGFALSVSPGRISLAGLMAIFQGPFSINECFFKKRTCPNMRRCKVKQKIDEIGKYVFRQLRAISISNFIPTPQNPGLQAGEGAPTLRSGQVGSGFRPTKNLGLLAREGPHRIRCSDGKQKDYQD
jgi:Rrf2 family protein